MKLTRLHVYRAIIVVIIALSFVLGYYRHGDIAHAALSSLIATVMVLGIFAAQRLIDKPLGRVLCRIGRHDWRYEEVKDAPMRYDANGARRGKTVGVLKCTRCGKPWVYIISHRDDAAIDALYPTEEECTRR